MTENEQAIAQRYIRELEAVAYSRSTAYGKDDLPVLTVNFIAGHIYVFSDELSCLRLFQRYVKIGTKGVNFGYSHSRETYYYSVEMSKFQKEVFLDR